MARSRRTWRTAVVGMPWASTSTSFGILDILASVGRDWELLHGGSARSRVFAPALLSIDGRPYDDPNGRRITPDGAFASSLVPHLIVVPDLHVAPDAPLPPELGVAADWIRAAYKRGSLVTSVCSGALVLAQTGLLDGLEATTHWGYADMLARRFPAVQVRRERILVPTGKGHRIITAGGASAWADLMLYLIGRIAGDEEARRIARIYLLQPHTDGQLCYASLTAGCQHEDKVVLDAQLWAADHYATANPVQAMAARSGLSERGFLRRFRRATGQTPVEYIQTLRIEEAKQMLEATDEPIEDIAAEVGYAEPSSFRHAFRRRVGLSASVYRRKRLPSPAVHEAAGAGL